MNVFCRGRTYSNHGPEPQRLSLGLVSVHRTQEQGETRPSLRQGETRSILSQRHGLVSPTGRLDCLSPCSVSLLAPGDSQTWEDSHRRLVVPYIVVTISVPKEPNNYYDPRIPPKREILSLTSTSRHRKELLTSDRSPQTWYPGWSWDPDTTTRKSSFFLDYSPLWVCSFMCVGTSIKGVHTCETKELGFYDDWHCVW